MNLRPFVPFKTANPKTYGKKTVAAFLTLSPISLFLLYFFQGTFQRETWTYSTATGACAWEEAVEPKGNEGKEIFGTLFAAYPGGGIRETFTQTEGFSGQTMGDDFFKINSHKKGMIKTQYPHLEGIWSYEDNMDQVILIVSNPLWAIRSYHALLAELDYAHTWQLAYQIARKGLFLERPPVEDWIRWRDYRFNDEIMLWGYHIDFWMENGTQYWMDMDFERNGQWPFRFLNDTEKPWPQSLPCKHYLECYPKTVVSYERMIEPATGVAEIRKIADLLRDKPGMDIIPDDALDCIYSETKLMNQYKTDADRSGPPQSMYNYTLPQLLAIQDKLMEYKVKYSSGGWIGNSMAEDLVSYFEEYLDVVNAEVDEASLNPPPTPAPDPNYLYDITQWYSSLGRGNRYTKNRVQAMTLWDYVKHYYEN